MKVEDGSGFSDADSYVSVDYADAFFSARGFSAWEPLTTAEKEVSLVKATDFVDSTYDWYGKRKTPNQSLQFPRINTKYKDGYDVEGIPDCLKKAVCEAVNCLVSGLTLYQSGSSGGAVTSEQIGQIRYTYDVGRMEKDKALYESINTKLRGLFSDSNRGKIYIGEVTR